jgi:hypothetical protein
MRAIVIAGTGCAEIPADYALGIDRIVPRDHHFTGTVRRDDVADLGAESRNRPSGVREPHQDD